MRTLQPGLIQFLPVILAILLQPACGKAPEPEAAPPVRPVKIMTIGSQGEKVTWEFPGKVTAVRNVELAFEVQGKIIELPIEDGLEASEGDLLARLDPKDYEAARDAAVANRKAMRSAYDRARKIFKQGAGSQAEVDKTERDILVAEQDLVKAQKALDDTVLQAPYSGVVASKIAEDFQNVRAKEPILIFQDTSTLEIDVNVPERDFVHMTPGMTLQQRTELIKPEISVSSIPGELFPARLKSFTTTADPVTRTYKATFTFKNPPAFNVLPGMTARVVLYPSAEVLSGMQGTSGMLVPAVAIAADENGNAYAWRVDADTMKVSRIPVTLGKMTGSDIRITEGLHDGDRIAVSGAAHLQEGMQVRPLVK
ncbi:MAG: efflux RND transporter periplasmic adaptor subunit [Gammaproteobacteria bacterium]|jgi:RND family efflux transporter MFP subunit|nr:efflux RND transporter periplasmic adaptor subunit [Gammaproteobacteria bacterium]